MGSCPRDRSKRSVLRSKNRFELMNLRLDSELLRFKLDRKKKSLMHIWAATDLNENESKA